MLPRVPPKFQGGLTAIRAGGADEAAMTTLSYRETLVRGTGEPGVEPPVRGNPWRGLLWIGLIVMVLYWVFK